MKKNEVDSNWSEIARIAYKKAESLLLLINTRLCPVDCRHCPFGKCITVALEEIAANIAAASGRVKV